MFEVVKVSELGYNDVIGCTTSDYWIKNVETGEVRILRECGMFDLEEFTEFEFDDCECIE